MLPFCIQSLSLYEIQTLMTHNFEDPEDIWMCSILFQKVNCVFSSTLKVKGIVVKYGSVSVS